nr:hypothetical protein [Tanacetum cinerariifolium]
IANLALQEGSGEGYGSLPTDFVVVEGTKMGKSVCMLGGKGFTVHSDAQCFKYRDGVTGTYHPSFPRPPPKPADAKFDVKTDAREEISVVMNDNDELECLDPRDEIDVSTDNKDDDYFSFMFFIRIFLQYLIYPKVFSFLLSAESEDTIFVSPFRAGGISLGWNFHVLSCLS